MKSVLRDVRRATLFLLVFLFALVGANVVGIELGMGAGTLAAPARGVPASYVADGALPELPRLDPGVVADAARESKQALNPLPSTPAPQTAGPGSPQPVSAYPRPSGQATRTPAPTSRPTPKPVTKPTVPGVPTNVVAVHSKNVRTLSWQPPASNGGSPITEYVIQGSYGYYVTVSGSTTSVTLANLSNSSYTFTVTAVNAVGAGPASAASNPISG